LGSNKTPKTKVKADAAKRPTSAVVEAKAKGLTWKFSKIDHDGPWPFHTLSSDDHKEVLKKLGAIETATFGEMASSRGTKMIPAENLCARAQKRLRELKLDDFGEIWEMHLKGKWRAWGMRQGETMLLVWWDPEHEVCPSVLS
jgi:hypothetical protein